MRRFQKLQKVGDGSCGNHRLRLRRRTGSLNSGEEQIQLGVVDVRTTIFIQLQTRLSALFRNRTYVGKSPRGFKLKVRVVLLLQTVDEDGQNAGANELVDWRVPIG